MYASSPLSPPGVGFGASNPIQLTPIYAGSGGMRSTSGAYGSGHPGSPLVRGGAGYPPQSPRVSSPLQSGGMAQASGAGAVVPPAVMQKMANQLGMAAQYGKDGKVIVKHTPGSENPSKFIVPQLPEGKEEKRKARAAYTTPTCVAQVQGPYNHVLSSGDFEVVFRYDFCYQTRTWAQTCMVVSIQKKPFAEGSLRNAYKAVDLSKPSGLGEFVAKEYKQKEKAECYFTDVDMQGICEFYAEKYNEKGPPKPVTFLHAFLIERVQRSGRPLLACEDFMKGKFDKFNNNYGFKSQGDEATPQAFSHFTFEESRQSIMIVDIQGIAEGDAYTYTDPQIHTLDGKGFGMGNLGREGMMKFFGTHLCNSICVGLGLARKQQGGFQSTAMNKEKVEEARKRRQALQDNKDKENKEQPQGLQYKEQFLTPASSGPHGSPVSGQQAPMSGQKSGKSEPMISEYEAKSGGMKQSL